MKSIFQRFGTQPMKFTFTIQVHDINLPLIRGLNEGDLLHFSLERGSKSIEGEEVKAGSISSIGDMKTVFNQTLTIGVTLYKDSKGKFQEKLGTLSLKQRKKGILGKRNDKEAFKVIGVVPLELHMLTERHDEEFSSSLMMGGRDGAVVNYKLTVLSGGLGRDDDDISSVNSSSRNSVSAPASKGSLLKSTASATNGNNNKKVSSNYDEDEDTDLNAEFAPADNDKNKKKNTTTNNNDDDDDDDPFKTPNPFGDDINKMDTATPAKKSPTTATTAGSGSQYKATTTSSSSGLKSASSTAKPTTTTAAKPATTTSATAAVTKTPVKSTMANPFNDDDDDDDDVLKSNSKSKSTPIKTSSSSSSYITTPTTAIATTTTSTTTPVTSTATTRNTKDSKQETLLQSAESKLRASQTSFSPSTTTSTTTTTTTTTTPDRKQQQQQSSSSSSSYTNPAFNNNHPHDNENVQILTQKADFFTKETQRLQELLYNMKIEKEQIFLEKQELQTELKKKIDENEILIQESIMTKLALVEVSNELNGVKKDYTLLKKKFGIISARMTAFEVDSVTNAQQ